MSIHIPAPLQHALEGPIAKWRKQYPKFAELADGGVAPTTTLRYLGLALWQDRRLEEAVTVYRANVSMTPDDPKLLSELGSVLGAAGGKEEAIGFLTAALEIDPNQPQVWTNVAGISVELGHRDVAEHAFLAALELAPDSTEALTGLGLLYIELRRFDEAAGLLSSAVQRGVTTPAVCVCLGQTQHLRGEFTESSLAYEMAALGAPTDQRIIRKYALARLIETLITEPVEQAIGVYHATAGDYAEDITTVCRVAFQALCGFAHERATLNLGRYLLERHPNDPIIAFHIDAITGKAHSRTPDDYLKACFDAYAPNFDKHLVEVLDYDLPRKCVALLDGVDARYSEILDLGCGTGLAAPYFVSLTAKLTGVDISSGMLAKARERNVYDELIESELLAYLDVSRKTFDLVISLDVMIYFGDLKVLFERVAARLAPGGIFAFSYENGDTDDYELLHTGRFVHSPTYIDGLVAKDFTYIADQITMIRLEANRPALGRIVLLRKT